MRRWCYSLGLVDVSVAGRLQHAGPHTLIIDPVGHGSNHVWQQRCRAMNELAELVHLHIMQLTMMHTHDIRLVHGMDELAELVHLHIRQ